MGERISKSAGTARLSLAELVGDHDAIAFRIKDAFRTDQPVDVGMLRSIRCRGEDQVRFRGVQLTIYLVGQMQRRNGYSAGKLGLTKIEGLIINHPSAFQNIE